MSGGRLPVIVVGEGPAGLFAASLLALLAHPVVVVAETAGTLELWDGHLDFRSWTDEERRPVTDPWAWWARYGPGHFAAGDDLGRWRRLWAFQGALFRELGVSGETAPPRQNRWLLTPLGDVRPAFRLTAWQYGMEEPEPVTVVGVEGFWDFVPTVVAEHYRRVTGLRAESVLLPRPREWEPSWQALRWATYLDRPEGRSWLVESVSASLGPARAPGPLLFPQILGLDTAERLMALLAQTTGRPVGEVGLVAPAVGGVRLARRWRRWLAQRGVATVRGRVAGVQAGRVALDDGRVLPARHVILATGGLLGGGLVLEPAGTVREPVSGVVVGTVADGVPPRTVARWGVPQDVGEMSAAGRLVVGCDPDWDGDGGAVALWTAAAAVERAVPESGGLAAWAERFGWVV